MHTGERHLVLLVDDTIVNLKVAVEHLKAHGLDVITARSGEAGVERARLAQPDLILLDVQLPGIDGFEACRRLKADPATRDIPVIFLTALADVDDKVRGFAAGGVDYITKPIQAEEVWGRVNIHLTIRDLQKSLEERVAELDAFAHTVAHDLKTPLAAVIGCVRLLERRGNEHLPEVTRDALAVIARNSHKMTSIVDELLTLASVRKQDDIETSPLAMGQIVQATLDRLRHLIDSSGAIIVKPDDWPVARGYAPWVEEIWANYIGNAVKYGGTPPRIELGADTPAKGPGGQPPFIRFWVRDNGRGLAESERAQLFQEFSRLGRHRSLQGHGLGLSIVQRIVKKLGGSVGVESTVGAGSTFYFTLPAAESISVPQAAIPSPTDALAANDPQLDRRHPLRILVVDDISTNRQLLALKLAQFGYRADMAASGREALTACLRQIYDLIFMDVEMAEMDGLEATRQIRRLGGAPAPWIIACTANTSQAARERCLAAGMDGFVSKTVEAEELLDTIRRAGANRSGPGHAGDRPIEPEHDVIAPPSPSSGDIPANRDQRVTNGAQTNADQHGYEPSLRVRPRPSTSNNGDSPEYGQPVLDPKALDRLRALVGGDPAMLAIVIESFLTDSPQLMTSLRQAVEQPNAQDMYMAAHSLKSLGASFGATSFAQLCRQLESLGQSGDLDAATEWLRQIEREYEHVRSALVALRNGPMA